MPFAGSPSPPPPWDQFLTETDRLIPSAAELHCLGGFVITVSHGRPRTTGDIDYIEISPRNAMADLERVAGRGSGLARKHGLFFQHVGVASLPDGYADRLTELFPRCFEKLRLFEVEAHDLALSKLTRNHPVDREDVAYLARTVPLDATTLRARYERELRPIIIGDAVTHDRTLGMWLEAYF